jgi:hypothetical protein
MSRVYSSQSLTWDGDVLRLNSREVARVEPDITYPAMWRVRLPNGSVSDMVNRTRAKDAAQYLALATLNRSSEAQGSHSGAATASLAGGRYSFGLPRRKSAHEPSYWLAQKP